MSKTWRFFKISSSNFLKIAILSPCVLRIRESKIVEQPSWRLLYFRESVRPLNGYLPTPIRLSMRYKDLFLIDELCGVNPFRLVQNSGEYVNCLAAPRNAINNSRGFNNEEVAMIPDYKVGLPTSDAECKFSHQSVFREDDKDANNIALVRILMLLKL
ncbi:hypothetical protein AVEN_107806-1 [Araneus ventricosus]|uniref:Uncharacterized protein n=1 Tax=Araneus ventricosus TaxID=182803 RepID=A0A4Y2VYZ9_ARAVE|nr:hypothetical protein AVEN_107806-1 [Araneus ventricosus]